MPMCTEMQQSPYDSSLVACPTIVVSGNKTIPSLYPNNRTFFDNYILLIAPKIGIAFMTPPYGGHACLGLHPRLLEGVNFVDNVDAMAAQLQTKDDSGHLAYLDGLRGLAALYVVLFHAIAISVPAKKMVTAPPIFRPLMFGFFAVAVFIVLSGFCLMLPVARSQEQALRGGLRAFVLRRARRILPPYYAVLALVFVLPLLETLLQIHHHPQHWMRAWCSYDGRYDLLAHIALVHNLWTGWCQNILPPLWSVATEWQIYVLFALLLLPALRRWGTFAALAVSVVISLGPAYILRSSHNLAWACPWFVILFTFGMIGAVIAQRQQDAPSTRMKVFLYRLALPCLVLVLLPDRITIPAWFAFWRWDILFGLLMIWLILRVYHQPRGASFWHLRRWLETRSVVCLGRFSYSLYLCHYLVLLMVVKLTSSYHLPPISQATLNLALGTPLAIMCAWMFYLIFERPFLSNSAWSQQRLHKER